MRFSSFHKKNVTQKNAIIYLKLRDDGCTKRKALQFSSRDPCRTDSTKRVDGPSNFKLLKVKSDPFSMTVNVISKNFYIMTIIGLEA